MSQTRNCTLCGRPLDDDGICTNVGRCAAWRYGIPDECDLIQIRKAN